MGSQLIKIVPSWWVIVLDPVADKLFTIKSELNALRIYTLTNIIKATGPKILQHV